MQAGALLSLGVDDRPRASAALWPLEPSGHRFSSVCGSPSAAAGGLFPACWDPRGLVQACRWFPSNRVFSDLNASRWHIRVAAWLFNLREDFL